MSSHLAAYNFDAVVKSLCANGYSSSYGMFRTSVGQNIAPEKTEPYPCIIIYCLCFKKP